MHRYQLSKADRLEIALMTPAQRREAIAALRHRLSTLADRLRTPLSRTERQRILDRAEAAHSALVVLEPLQAVATFLELVDAGKGEGDAS